MKKEIIAINYFYILIIVLRVLIKERKLSFMFLHTTNKTTQQSDIIVVLAPTSLLVVQIDKVAMINVVFKTF